MKQNYYTYLVMHLNNLASQIYVLHIKHVKSLLKINSFAGSLF